MSILHAGFLKEWLQFWIETVLLCRLQQLINCYFMNFKIILITRLKPFNQSHGLRLTMGSIAFNHTEWPRFFFRAFTGLEPYLNATINDHDRFYQYGTVIINQKKITFYLVIFDIPDDDTLKLEECKIQENWNLMEHEGGRHTNHSCSSWKIQEKPGTVTFGTWTPMKNWDCPDKRNFAISWLPWSLTILRKLMVFSNFFFKSFFQILFPGYC